MRALIIKRKWWRLTTIGATFFTATFGAFISLGAGPQCTSPFVQVQDVAATLFPDPTNQFTIERVNIGEPFVNCSTKHRSSRLAASTTAGLTWRGAGSTAANAPLGSALARLRGQLLRTEPSP